MGQIEFVPCFFLYLISFLLLNKPTIWCTSIYSTISTFQPRFKALDILSSCLFFKFDGAKVQRGCTKAWDILYFFYPTARNPRNIFGIRSVNLMIFLELGNKKRASKRRVDGLLKALKMNFEWFLSILLQFLVAIYGTWA